MIYIYRASWVVIIAALIAAAIAASADHRKTCDLFGPPDMDCRP